MRGLQVFCMHDLVKRAKRHAQTGTLKMHPLSPRDLFVRMKILMLYVKPPGLQLD